MQLAIASVTYIVILQKMWTYKDADSILYYDPSFPRMRSRIIISIIDHCQHTSLKLTSSFIIGCSEAKKSSYIFLTYYRKAKELDTF